MYETNDAMMKKCTAQYRLQAFPHKIVSCTVRPSKVLPDGMGHVLRPWLCVDKTRLHTWGIQKKSQGFVGGTKSPPTPTFFLHL